MLDKIYLSTSVIRRENLQYSGVNDPTLPWDSKNYELCFSSPPSIDQNLIVDYASSSIETPKNSHFHDPRRTSTDPQVAKTLDEFDSSSLSCLSVRKLPLFIDLSEPLRYQGIPGIKIQEGPVESSHNTTITNNNRRSSRCHPHQSQESFQSHLSIYLILYNMKNRCKEEKQILLNQMISTLY